MNEEKLINEDVLENNEQTEEQLENNDSEVIQEEEQDDQEKALQEIDELKKQITELEDRNLRLQADMENIRRRAKLDLQSSEKYRSQNLITNLVPVIDNFERALQTKSDNEEVKSLLSGLEMVYKSLIESLKTEGAVQIEAAGQQFDPNFHEAVMQVEDDNFESNIIVEEFQKGYILKDRVIRPSMVKVNK